MYWIFSESMSFNNSREIPLDIDNLMSLLGSYEPENEYQALMECLPHEEALMSKDIINETREIVLDCVDMLLDNDKYIVNAINYEQVSYLTLGERLGVSATHAWRLKQIAYRHLAEVLVIDGRISKMLRYD
jgi:DNA-directed RNA polymerase specialized sigma24 family protein